MGVRVGVVGFGGDAISSARSRCTFARAGCAFALLMPLVSLCLALVMAGMVGVVGVVEVAASACVAASA